MRFGISPGHELAHAVRVLRQALREMQDRPEHALGMIADAWATVWEAALARVWPQLDRLLRADIAVRSRMIASTGIARMAGDLHRQVTGERAQSASRCAATANRSTAAEAAWCWFHR